MSELGFDDERLSLTNVLLKLSTATYKTWFMDGRGPFVLF